MNDIWIGPIVLLGLAIIIGGHQGFMRLFPKKPKKDHWQETLDFETELKADFEKCVTEADLDAVMLKAYNFMTAERGLSPSPASSIHQMSADEFVKTEAIHLFRIQTCCRFDGKTAYDRIQGVQE